MAVVHKEQEIPVYELETLHLEKLKGTFMAVHSTVY